jgi:hypothetical protein
VPIPGVLHLQDRERWHRDSGTCETKSPIKVGYTGELISTRDALRVAVASDELDARIDTASETLRLASHSSDRPLFAAPAAKARNHQCRSNRHSLKALPISQNYYTLLAKTSQADTRLILALDRFVQARTGKKK